MGLVTTELMTSRQMMTSLYVKSRMSCVSSICLSTSAEVLCWLVAILQLPSSDCMYLVLANMFVVVSEKISVEERIFT